MEFSIGSSGNITVLCAKFIHVSENMYSHEFFVQMNSW